jgi:hypothetical protein
LANNLNVNPVYIDTAFQSYKSSVAATLGSLFTLIVTQIKWVGPSAAGQVVIFDDPQGGVQLLQMTSAAANTDVTEDFSASPRIWRDFSVAQLPSGKLFVFLK